MQNTARAVNQQDICERGQMACIYCGRHGPFTDEHVFPKALCGGGQGSVLHDLVCSCCNNKFSKAELQLMRARSGGFLRTAYGPSARHKAGVRLHTNE